MAESRMAMVGGCGEGAASAVNYRAHRYVTAIALATLACLSCGHKNARQSFAEVVARATVIEIGRRPDHEYPHGIGGIRFLRRSDPGVFAMLGSARSAVGPAGGPTGVKMIVIGGVKIVDYYDYEPTSGRPRVANEWLEVPPVLRDRFKSAIATAVGVQSADRRLSR